jgi:hypothetical protein
MKRYRVQSAAFLALILSSILGMSANQIPQHPGVAAYAEFKPETLEQHATPVSSEVAQWLEKRKRLLGLMVLLPASLSRYPEYWQLVHGELQQHGLENLSPHNYVVKFTPAVGQEAHVLKIAGPINRISEIMSANEYYGAAVLSLQSYLQELKKRAHENNEPFVPANFKRLARLIHPVIVTAEELNELNVVDTFQTVSRLPIYLVCKRVIEQRGLQEVFLPHMTVVKLDESKKHSDDNSVVIQRFIENIEPLTEHNKDAVSDQAIKEVTILICNAGLWSLQNTHITKEGKVMLIGTEEPNNEKPQQAFFQNESKFNWNVRSGLHHWASFFKGDAEKIQLIFDTAKEEGALEWLSATHTQAGVKQLEADFANLK